MDTIERKILNTLQSDCSGSIADIADRAGVSQTPCWRRIKQREEAGYIDKRVTLLNPKDTESDDDRLCHGQNRASRWRLAYWLFRRRTKYSWDRVNPSNGRRHRLFAKGRGRWHRRAWRNLQTPYQSCRAVRCKCLVFYGMHQNNHRATVGSAMTIIPDVYEVL